MVLLVAARFTLFSVMYQCRFLYSFYRCLLPPSRSVLDGLAGYDSYSVATQMTHMVRPKYSMMFEHADDI